MLAGNKRRAKTKLIWVPGANTAFEKSKVNIANASPFIHPSASATWSISVDAPDCAIGWIELNRDSEVPLEYFSGAFSECQQRYGTYDVDFAIYEAINHFWHKLQGRAFTRFSSYKLL